MAFRDLFRPPPVELAEAVVPEVEFREVAARADSLEMRLEESIAQLELAQEDIGWRRIAAEGQVEFSEAGQRRFILSCQLLALANPILRRGLALRTAYTWGEGVDVSAPSPRSGEPGQDVNAVVQAFMDDESNRKSFSGAVARSTMDTAVQTDGSVFFALFTSPLTGRVQVRVIPRMEIGEVRRNPQDRTEEWFFRHDYVEETVDSMSGGVSSRSVSKWYPALGYSPAVKPAQREGWPIDWSAPVVHHFEERPTGWRFGLPVAYSALPWARAYAEFLRDWAVLVKALSRYAYQTSGPGRKQAATKAAIQRAPTRDPLTRDVEYAGATIQMGPDQTISAVPKTGATIDSGSGRPLAMMVSSALGLPVTMILADPGQTGARATAETLDRPTELTMALRRQIWEETLRRILGHVIDAAIKARVLAGTVTRDRDGREVIALADDQDRAVSITWPELDDVNVVESVGAIVAAATTGKIPPLVVARLLLQLLGVDNLDEVIEAMTGPNGEWVDPNPAVAPPVDPNAVDPNAPPPVPDGRIGVRGYHRAPRAKPDPVPDPDPNAPPA